jgi:hypothetical protein
MDARKLPVLLLVALLTAPAGADDLCIKATARTRTIKIRALGCRSTEVKIGSFDGATLQLSGINLQIVSGSGATDGATNGTGNLIVGYNEDTGFDRSGSHNIVLGRGNGYSAWGGIVSGEENRISAANATVIAAYSSQSTGAGVVVGGIDNTAGIGASAVFGGQGNAADGVGSTVVGGSSNTANGISANVTGGICNAAGNLPADPTCTAPASCGLAVCGAAVSGGFKNSATADHATVSGGLSRSVSDIDDWAAGTLLEDF